MPHLTITDLAATLIAALALLGAAAFALLFAGRRVVADVRVWLARNFEE